VTSSAGAAEASGAAVFGSAAGASDSAAISEVGTVDSGTAEDKEGSVPSEGAACCARVCAVGAVLDSCVEVCAPPELRTTTGGLLLPGADTDTDVSDPEDTGGSAALVGDVPVAAVRGPPELLTTLVGRGGDSAVDEDVDEDSVDSDSVSPDVDDEDVEVEESASVGSPHAMPGIPATAAPTPRAAANNPIRPMYSA